MTENLQPWIIVTTVAMTVMALTAAWYLMTMGFVIAMIKYKIGIHAYHVKADNIIMLAKLLLVAEVLYIVNLPWTKLSLLFMFYSIFHFSSFKRQAYIIDSFIIAWAICGIFLLIFICVPVQKLWYPQLPGHCINQMAAWIANATSIILTDIAILIIPIPHFWKLQLRKSEKIALTSAFSLGFFVVFASAYRFSVLFSYRSDDLPYTLTPTVGWTLIEMSAGITSACLPTLRPAIQFICRSLHIEHSMSLFRSSANRTKNAGTELNVTNGASQGQLRSRSQGGNGLFVCLEELRINAGTFNPELALEHGNVHTVISKQRSGDEVPLRGIAEKEFSQVVS
ncbi:hypothetical protein B7463_g5835, partial [Scytalidium lignicola]